jgi:hypothetical protein
VTKPNGSRRLLLVNKRDRDVELTLPQQAALIEFVDQATKGDPPSKRSLTGTRFTLHGLEVASITFGSQ